MCDSHRKHRKHRYFLLKVNGFPKQERIVSQKLIEELFTSGQSHSLTAFPLRAVFLNENGNYNENENVKQNEDEKQNENAVKLLLSVPKRRFKHAVDRNRVKRQLREAFRKHKHLLADVIPDGQSRALAFVWMSDRHMLSADVEQRVVTLLKRIGQTITNKQ
ncbi:MAG: ribonuclease P protein component [Prevotella sp.]|nr:ribonuclease P protein component [Prevotella sp.]